jgi:hypothetical protein
MEWQTMLNLLAPSANVLNTQDIKKSKTSNNISGKIVHLKFITNEDIMNGFIKLTGGFNISF